MSDFNDETDNLDCVDISEVDAYFFDESKPAQLREYAGAKRLAMRARLDGRIDVALAWEKTCESIYSRLPENLKW